MQDWKEFVLNFVSDIDSDRAKNLDPTTAEVEEDAAEDLNELVEAAKKYAREYLNIEVDKEEDTDQTHLDSIKQEAK